MVVGVHYCCCYCNCYCCLDDIAAVEAFADSAIAGFVVDLIVGCLADFAIGCFVIDYSCCEIESFDWNDCYFVVVAD